MCNEQPAKAAPFTSAAQQRLESLGCLLTFELRPKKRDYSSDPLIVTPTAGVTRLQKRESLRANTFLWWWPTLGF